MSVGKFHDFIAAVAVVCVMFRSVVHADLGQAWVNSMISLQWLVAVVCCVLLSMGKFCDFVAVVAIICVMFGLGCECD